MSSRLVDHRPWPDRIKRREFAGDYEVVNAFGAQVATSHDLEALRRDYPNATGWGSM